MLVLLVVLVLVLVLVAASASVSVSVLVWQYLWKLWNICSMCNNQWTWLAHWSCLC